MDSLIDQFVDIRTDKDRPHKPLLLLMAIAKLLEGQRRLSFTEVKEELTPLLDRYAPPVKSGKQNVADPYWRLANDGMWLVEDAESLPRQQSGFPLLSALRETSAGFTDEAAEVLVEDEEARGIVIQILLGNERLVQFGRDDILGHVGLGVASLSDTDIAMPEEMPEGGQYLEGAATTVKVNRYERNRVARNKCVKHYGYVCLVCDTDLFDIYGAIAESFIHVHHIKPLADIGESYEVDPIEDLIPVCPNCHAMIHRRNPPYLPEEIRAMIEQRKG